jgi:outer membrane protein TolC
MKRLYISLLCCAWTAFPGPAQTLTLQEALSMGLRSGQRADTALAETALARVLSNRRAARAALMPQAELRMSGGERSVNLGAQGFGGIGGGSLPFRLNPSFTTFDVRPVVSATLFNYSQWRNFRSLEQDQARAGRDGDWARDQAAKDIALKYTACLEARASLASATASVELASQLLQAAEQRLAAGTVTAIDVSRARAQLAADRSSQLVQQQELLEAEANLFRAMGAEATSSTALAPLPLLLPPDLTTALASAQSQRADLQAREKAAQATRARAKAIGWEKLPSISASFDAGRNGLTPADNALTRNSTLSLNMTIYDFGRRKEKETEAAVGVREEEIRLRDLRAEIRLQVTLAASRLASAQARRLATAAEKELAVVQLDQVRERQSAGLAIGLDLNDAQTRLTRSDLALVRADYDIQKATIELLHAAGQLRSQLNY